MSTSGEWVVKRFGKDGEARYLQKYDGNADSWRDCQRCAVRFVSQEDAHECAHELQDKRKYPVEPFVRRLVPSRKRLSETAKRVITDFIARAKAADDGEFSEHAVHCAQTIGKEIEEALYPPRKG